MYLSTAVAIVKNKLNSHRRAGTNDTFQNDWVHHSADGPHIEVSQPIKIDFTCFTRIWAKRLDTRFNQVPGGTISGSVQSAWYYGCNQQVSFSLVVEQSPCSLAAVPLVEVGDTLSFDILNKPVGTFEPRRIHEAVCGEGHCAWLCRRRWHFGQRRPRMNVHHRHTAP